MPTDFESYVLQNKIVLPFSGVWKAVNASRQASNPHLANPNQLFAVDFIQVDSAGRSHRGKGEQLAEYHCYGSYVLAVADALVVSVVDGVPEHAVAGIRDRYNVAGNHVVLDLGCGEFAFYAHLIPGEIKVKAGARVRSGNRYARPETPATAPSHICIFRS